MNTYCARYLYRDNDGQLKEQRQEFIAQSDNEAKIIFKNTATQNNYRKLMLFTGSFSIPGKYIYQ